MAKEMFRARKVPLSESYVSGGLNDLGQIYKLNYLKRERQYADKIEVAIMLEKQEKKPEEPEEKGTCPICKKELGDDGYESEERKETICLDCMVRELENVNLCKKCLNKAAKSNTQIITKIVEKPTTIEKETTKKADINQTIL